MIASAYQRYGVPGLIHASFTKNTNKYVKEIVETWAAAGVRASGVLSIQTTDETTLTAVRRKNIRLERYEELATQYREARLPMGAEVIVGLPGSTLESFKRDLQHFFQLDMRIRMFQALMLPNSPMNEPSEREAHQIEVGEQGQVLSTASYTETDRDEMMRLRYWWQSLEQLGAARNVLTYMQGDFGLRAIDVVHCIDRVVNEDPFRYPCLSWFGRFVDLYLAPPGSWRLFYQELAEFCTAELQVETDPALCFVLELEEFLRPRKARKFPDSMFMKHDFVSYRRDVLAGTTSRLSDYGGAELVVTDPNSVCDTSSRIPIAGARRERVGENDFWWDQDWELSSPLSWDRRPELKRMNGS